MGAVVDLHSAPEPDDRWAPRICAAWQRSVEGWQKSVEGILEAGRLLAEAKAALPHGGFEIMVRDQLPFSVRTVQTLMQIAGNPVLSNAQHVALLPPSWGTLAALARVKPLDLKEAIDAGSVQPDMTRAEVDALAKKTKTIKRPVVESATSPPIPNVVLLKSDEIAVSSPVDEPEVSDLPPMLPEDPAAVAALRAVVEALGSFLDVGRSLQVKVDAVLASGVFGRPREYRNDYEHRSIAEMLDDADLGLVDLDDMLIVHDKLADLCGLPVRREPPKRAARSRRSS
jgi:hypothetical protein